MNALKQVAIAVLFQGDRYLMQLRDPIPTIPYPGQWGFFGGHLEADETPPAAIQRELAEEIGYSPPVHFFRQYADETAVRHVFAGAIAVPLSTLTLQEGWDFGFLSLDQIHAGTAYSAVAQRYCPVGILHRQIVLDFHDDRLSKAGPE